MRAKINFETRLFLKMTCCFLFYAYNKVQEHAYIPLSKKKKNMHIWNECIYLFNFFHMFKMKVYVYVHVNVYKKNILH